MRRVVALTLGILLSLPAASRPQRASGPEEREALARLAAESAVPLVVRQKPGARFPFFVQGRIPLGRFTSATDSAQRGRDFLRKYGAIFGIKEESSELAVRSATSDAVGMTHVRYDQRHAGLPVFGRQLVVHMNSQAVTAVNGDFADVEGVPTTPQVAPGAARETALAHLGKRGPRAPAEPRLLVHVDGSGRPRLAWAVSVATTSPLGFWRVFVDALDGRVLFFYDDLKTARNRNTYTNGNDPDCNFFEAPQCTLPGTIRRIEAQAAIGDAPIDGAHENAGITYDYYQTTFGRDSYDGAGHEIRSTAHFGAGYNNAFWCPDDCAAAFASTPDGEQMVYGDGNGVLFSPLGQGLDVVAHELTHAVTDSTAGLLYFDQSGALNESYSDVFAAMVDTPDWLIGEDVFTPGIPGDALRSMVDPPLFDQPGHFANYVYLFLFDSGGVHINSGIPNKAAYLTADAPGYGVGRPATQQIYYRALTMYLTPTSDFLANLNALLQASTDLFGAGSAQTTAVRKAQAAVGVANAPTVTFPNGGESLVLGAPATITWISPGDAGIGFQVDALRDLGAVTYSQNFEAGPALPAEFTSSGNQPWLISTAVPAPAGGARYARSGVITHLQLSRLKLIRTMTAPGNVSFLARVSSELNFDYFSFSIDGEAVAFGSGEIPWSLLSVPVSAGTHEFVWLYEKDGSVSTGLDAALIDNLTIPNSENATVTSINPATAPGATSQSWTPSTPGSNYRVRVRLPGLAPWLGSDQSNGLFSVVGVGAGFFYTLTPCRAVDTRKSAGPHGGPALAAGGTRTFTIVGRCSIPSNARTVAFNVTVTNPTAGGHLTLYPGGLGLPLSSTLNFGAGQTRANNAMIPLGAGGDVAAFAGIPAGTADVILDVNGYFD